MATARPKVLNLNMNCPANSGLSGLPGLKLYEMYDLVDTLNPDIVCVQDMAKAFYTLAGPNDVGIIMSGKGYYMWYPTMSERKLPGWDAHPQVEYLYITVSVIFYKKALVMSNTSGYFSSGGTNGFIGATFVFPATGETFAVFNVSIGRGTNTIPTDAQSDAWCVTFNSIATQIATSMATSGSVGCLKVYAGLFGVRRSRTANLTNSTGSSSTYGVLVTLSLLASYGSAGTLDTFGGAPTTGDNEICYIISSTPNNSPYLPPVRLTPSVFVNNTANNYPTPSKNLCT